MAERHRVNSCERAKPNFQVERNCGEATRNGQQHSAKGGWERPSGPPRGEQDYRRPIPVRPLHSVQESSQPSQVSSSTFSQDNGSRECDWDAALVTAHHITLWPSSGRR